jgi:hypothetical protein
LAPDISKEQQNRVATDTEQPDDIEMLVGLQYAMMTRRG